MSQLDLIIKLGNQWSNLTDSGKVTVHAYLTECGPDTDNNMLHNCVVSLQTKQKEEINTTLVQLLDGLSKLPQ